ncbi:S-adenosyl-L-methionine-dependent methyltransferase [Xylariaceae sp. FL0255]|nr:S-adenosyl-L-methionine-dependent methyltransferase [Xylariaceae sp. FL0255]
MFAVRNHGRRRTSLLLLDLATRRRSLSSTCYRLAQGEEFTLPKKYDNSIMAAEHPLAEQIRQTGLHPTAFYKTRGEKPTFKIKGKIDKSRVNVVSEKLIDDIFDYIGPSLERHRGCDILELFPGSGLWSRKLHDRLEPRSHILMEPDIAFYQQFLQPLLDRPGVTVVPRNGVIWKDLNSVLTDQYFPHQTLNKTGGNDTLLVTANLAAHPAKNLYSFPSLTALVLHQFIDAISSHRLFHKYGRVRMLIWTRSDEKSAFIPRAAQKQRKQGIETELYCEWVHEVCGHDPSEPNWFARENALNEASAVATANRMLRAGLHMPAGREPLHYQTALPIAEEGGTGPIPGQHPPSMNRKFLKELEGLEASQTLEDDPELPLRRRGLRYRAVAYETRAKKMHRFSTELDAIRALHRNRASTEEIKVQEAAWREKWQSIGDFTVREFQMHYDNLHVWRQSEPVLSWDQRAYEPLQIEPTEFYPNVPCSLLDINPKTLLHPLMTETGPGSSRAADYFEMMLRFLFNSPSKSVEGALTNLWPGALDHIMPLWTSLHDLSPGAGGFLPHLAHAGPTPRAINSKQWTELLELWMDWPFRPEFHELVARTTEVEADTPEDMLHDAQ